MKLASGIALVVCLLGLSAAVPPSSSAAVDENFLKDTKTYLSRLEKLGFAGVVVISEKGAPVMAEGYGMADRERGLPWTPATVASTGSITKQFTAAGIMRLQEEGRLKTTDPISKYFENVPPDKAGITLHHLLTHSSGIVDPEGIGDFDPVSRDEYVRTVLESPLQSAPGERYEYSNAGFSLLGAVIEMVTARSYEEAMRDLVFTPAGLARTGYKSPAWSGLTVAQGYRGGERWGTVLERPMAEDGPYWALRANGGIHSTAEDMVRWANVLLDDSLLEAPSREAMWTPFVDESNGDSASFYGYGWVIMDAAPGVRVVTHNGGNGIFFADLAIVPSLDTVVFLQTNVLAEFPAVNRLLEQIGARMLGGAPYPAVPEVVAVEKSALDSWAGRYVFENGEEMEARVDRGSLSVEPRGWSAWAYVNAGPGENVERLAALSRETDRIVGAFVGGDLAPLHEAYGKSMPLEELEATYKERMKGWEEDMGPFVSYEVLGTSTTPRHLFTLVRFVFEKGDMVRAYAWEPGEEGRLAGMVMRPFATTTRFYPVDGGRLESWDPMTGASLTVRIETSPEKTTRFVLMRDGREITAEKAE